MTEVIEEKSFLDDIHAVRATYKAPRLSDLFRASVMFVRGDWAAAKQKMRGKLTLTSINSEGQPCMSLSSDSKAILTHYVR